MVDFDQSRHMERLLKRAGKAVALVRLEGEDHHLSSPATRLQALEAVVSFINEHIGQTEP